jgi:exodeoxyribonuclease III
MHWICRPILLWISLAMAGCATTPPVHLVNWNTYHLFTYQQHKEAAAQWLADQAVTIAAFQEVLNVNEQQLQQLARTWGHDYAVMNKTTGYPVALTSSAPITVIERRVKGFHHGYLHARTHGFDVLVVHFWPGKVHEADHVAKLAKGLVESGRRVLVVGDFNAEIRHDEDYLQAHGHLGSVKDGVRSFDYRITDAFLEAGFLDVTHAYAPAEQYTFGSPALIPRWRKDMSDVHTTRRRIDYIFADGITAKLVRHTDVFTDDATVGLWSDHYPMRARLSPLQRTGSEASSR